MADKISFEYEVKGITKSINSVKELKSAMTELNDVMENAELGSNEFKQAQEQFSNLQETLVDVTSGAEEVATGFSKLKKELKQAKNEQADAAEKFGVGSKEWKKAAQNVGKLNEELEELKLGAQSLRGSGIERLESSMQVFRQGLTTADFGKFKIGLHGLGAAMKAIPILLIVEGVKYLIEVFNELKESGGLLGAIFKGIGTAIDAVKGAFSWVADKLGIIDLKAQNAAAAVKKFAEDSKQALDEQAKTYDYLIAKASAQGKSTVSLEIEKQQNILNTNKMLIQQLKQLEISGQELTDEQKKLMKDATDNMLASIRQIDLIKEKQKADDLKKQAEAQKEKDTKAKEASQKAKELRDKHLAETKQYEDQLKQLKIANIKDELDRLKAQHDEELANVKATDELGLNIKRELEKKYDTQRIAIINKREEEDKLRLKKEQDDKDKLEKDILIKEQKYYDAERLAKAELRVESDKEDLQAQKVLLNFKMENELSNEELTESQRLLIYKKYEKEKEAIDKEAMRKRLDNAKTFSDTSSQLSSLVFDIQLNNVKKGSKEELEIRKKQFEVNKAFQIANAVINGAQGVLAITTVPDFTLGVMTAIRIAGQVALTALTVAKIASTKFDGGSASGGGINVPSAPAPNIHPNTQPVTYLGHDGQPINNNKNNFTVKAHVLESDVTHVQKQNQRYANQATF